MGAATVGAAPTGSSVGPAGVAVVHAGPAYFVGPASLIRIAKPHTIHVTAEEADQEGEIGVRAPPPAKCAKRICGEKSHAARRRSPPTTAPVYTCCLDSIDPQIASSDKGFLVVGMRDHILLYDKGGTPLYPKQGDIPDTTPGLPAPYGQIDLCDLFAPIIPDANAHLGLPTGKTDAEGHKITVKNGYGINCNAQTGGVEPPGWKTNAPSFYWPHDELYDARVLWDSYDKRFWIAALFKNSNTVAYPDPLVKDPLMLRPSTRSANVRSARRAMLAIAVSKTDDPRDGWYLSWVYGYPGQTGCPNSKSCVGFGTDYMSMGITSKYLTMESSGSTVPSQQSGGGGRVITIVPTAPLAAGGGAHYWQPRPFPSSTPLLQPAIQHAPDFDHGKEALFAAPIYNLDDGAAGSRIEVLAIQPQASPYEGVPSVFTQIISVHQFHAVSGSSPEKGGGSIDLTQNWVNKLVYSRGNLYLAMNDCELWNDTGCVNSGIRVIRLRLGGVVRSHGRISRLKLGYGSQQEISGAFALGANGPTWFGFPSIEVNDSGDVVASYQGTSPKIFADASYSVMKRSESTFGSSRVMKSGEGPADGWHHYLGMSVDGFDGTGVWMINGYGGAPGGWSYAFAKVLGKPVPDLDVLKASVAPGSGGPRSFELDLYVDNLGDGDAPATSATLTLTRHGSKPVAVETLKVPAIAHGANDSRTVDFTAPPTPKDLGGYSLEIQLDSGQKLTEYDEANNRATVPLP